MYEKVEICPSCKFTEFQNELIVTDHSISQESFALVKCKKCKLIFTSPRPALEHIGKYYESEDYISHQGKSNNLINFIYKIVRGYTLNQKKKMIQQYEPGKGKVLDFGCGTGDFLNTCKKAGWRICGVEPNNTARKQAIDLNGDSIFSSLEKVDKKEKFDVITAWHVLEHVHELKLTIKALKKLLKKGGTLIIAVPNHLSYDASYYKEYWAGYDVPRHLYHFSKQSFSYLMSKSRLTLIDTRPMKFDSFYVSLLSEKYKNGRSSFIKAFQIGLKSNRMAKKTGNYSSLIYVLKK